MPQRGAAGVVAAALVAAGLVLALLVVDIAQVIHARTRLTTAADAAALAAAPITFARFGTSGSPAEEARELANANGAELLDCICAIDRSWSRREVVVVVGSRVELLLLGSRRLTATAAAEFRPTQLVSY
jgi:secretion/DNA translocation related TadE-like protein